MAFIYKIKLNDCLKLYPIKMHDRTIIRNRLTRHPPSPTSMRDLYVTLPSSYHIIIIVVQFASELSSTIKKNLARLINAKIYEAFTIVIRFGYLKRSLVLLSFYKFKLNNRWSRWILNIFDGHILFLPYKYYTLLETDIDKWHLKKIRNTYIFFR